MENLTVQSRAYDKTENGTPIIEPGKETDTDMFLKLLVAQMTNQDPFNPQDPTQYITQLAQFSTLEQLMTLNDGMEYLLNINNGMLVNSALSTSTALIGKEVELSSPDEDGNYEDYSGTVQSTFIKNGVVYLEVKLDETGEVKEFRYETLVKVSQKSEEETK